MKQKYLSILCSLVIGAQAFAGVPTGLINARVDARIDQKAQVETMSLQGISPEGPQTPIMLSQPAEVLTKKQTNNSTRHKVSSRYKDLTGFWKMSFFPENEFYYFGCIDKGNGKLSISLDENDDNWNWQDAIVEDGDTYVALHIPSFFELKNDGTTSWNLCIVDIDNGSISLSNDDVIFYLNTYNERQFFYQAPDDGTYYQQALAVVKSDNSGLSLESYAFISTFDNYNSMAAGETYYVDGTVEARNDGTYVYEKDGKLMIRNPFANPELGIEGFFTELELTVDYKSHTVKGKVTDPKAAFKLGTVDLSNDRVDFLLDKDGDYYVTGSYDYADVNGNNCIVLDHIVGVWSAETKDYVNVYHTMIFYLWDKLENIMGSTPQQEEPGEDPGEDPGEQPGEDPGEDPGEQPGEQPETKIELSLTAQADTNSIWGTLDYTVTDDTAPSSMWIEVDGKVVNVTFGSKSYTVTGLNPETTYTVRFCAQYGSKLYYAEATVTTEKAEVTNLTYFDIENQWTGTTTFTCEGYPAETNIDLYSWRWNFLDQDIRGAYRVKVSGLDPETTNHLIWKGQYINNNGYLTDLEPIDLTFVTKKIRWGERFAQTVNKTSARLVCESNLDAVSSVGFEWCRYDAPSDIDPNRVECPSVDGRMVGTLRNLDPNVYYKFRPYYKSGRGKMYYGEWKSFSTADAEVEFEPEVNTCSADVDGNTVDLGGYLIEGSDEFGNRGFELRAVSGGTLSLSAPAKWQTIASETKGLYVSHTLSDLAIGTYEYRAYAETSEGKQYGQTVRFKVKTVSPGSNVEGVTDAVAADEEGFWTVYNIAGMCVMRTAERQQLKTLAPGFYIVNGRKYYVK